MTYDIEIMLRGDEVVHTDTVHHIGNEPAQWTAEDASTIMHAVLQAIDKVLNPDRSDEPAATSLRGVNWIVTPGKDGAVLALEIHSASAVAGPFPLPCERLEALMTDAARTPLTSAPVVH
jgi:hypothetical protein